MRLIALLLVVSSIMLNAWALDVVLEPYKYLPDEITVYDLNREESPNFNAYECECGRPYNFIDGN